MADATTPQTYFLSYSRSDEQFALRLAKDLRAGGVAMWVDQLDIRPSEHWDRAIERAVRACSGLVVILSPRSVVSDNVADEISFAIDSGKSVLPVMIEKCKMPLRITRMHHIDATKSYDEALRQCLGALEKPEGGEVAASTRPSEPVARLDPETLSTATRKLAAFLGPIAAIVVNQDAARAGSATELYRHLALHIDNETDRARFLATGPIQHMPPDEPAGNEAPIPPAELETLATALTSYLGPIATIVTKRESRACGSIADLRDRLAALIPAERDRREFLHRVG